MKLISAVMLTFITLKEWTAHKDESRASYILLPTLVMWLMVLEVL